MGLQPNVLSHHKANYRNYLKPVNHSNISVILKKKLFYKSLGDGAETHYGKKKEKEQTHTC